MSFAVFSVLLLLVGLWVGHQCSLSGMTADNAVRNHQRQGYQWGAIALSVFLGLVALLTVGNQSPLVPTVVLLYAGAYWLHGVLLLCVGLTGFVVGLEKSGWRQPQRLQQLIIFVVIGCAATGFLWHRQQPIDNLVGQKIIDGIVWQTTPYSCAAAAIATLSRQVYPQQNITEADVVAIAGTSRQGTSVLAEIRAMEQLGLKPEYRRHLTVEDLVERQQLAVLHVREPISGRRIGHAIALLGAKNIDAESSLIVANPINGLALKTAQDMEGYWINEAVFVTASR